MSVKLADWMRIEVAEDLRQRKEKKKAENKEKVLNALREFVVEQAKKCERIFLNSHNDDVEIPPNWKLFILIQLNEGKIIPDEEALILGWGIRPLPEVSIDEVKEALRDIGFIVKSYTATSFPAIPDPNNKSEEIASLLKSYEDLLGLTKHEVSETAKSEAKIFMTKLRNKEFNSVTCCVVRVKFSSRFSTMMFYRDEFNKILNGEGLNVSGFDGEYWYVSF